MNSSSGITEPISLQPTQTGTGYITSLTVDQMAGAAEQKINDAPFATTASSFLSDGKDDPLEVSTRPRRVGIDKKVDLQMDMPLPLDILHPEVKAPNFANCTSHSDAISTGECNTWCALNPEECLNGFVGLAENICHERAPNMSVCDCLRAMQKEIHTRGSIPLTIIANPILNSKLTQALLSGPIINKRCGDVTAANAAARALVTGQVAPIPTKEKFFFTRGSCKDPETVIIQAVLVALALYWIARRF
jgi:hypothetical protein